MSTNKRTVINRGERSITLNEVSPTININKNPLNLQVTSHMKDT